MVWSIYCTHVPVSKARTITFNICFQSLVGNKLTWKDDCKPDLIFAYCFLYVFGCYSWFISTHSILFCFFFFFFLFYSTYLYIRDDLCRPLHSYLVLPSAYIIVHIIAAHSLLTKRERKPFRPLTTMYSPLQFLYHQPTYNKDTHHEDTTSLY